MENFSSTTSQSTDMSHINGWAIDADPNNNPAYPMRQGTPDKQRYAWERPALQPQNTEVLHSNERPNLTAVFGTSVAPSGLSGMIRRFAFRYSEGSFGHWLPLLLADRINVLEGIADDLRHGKVPNICAEQGIRAEWKYNQKAVVRKAAIAAVITTSLVLLFARNKRE
jgi:hypothetical protein